MVPPSRPMSLPDDSDGTPECEVSTNILRWPSSRSHITGLFESTSPGSSTTGALINVACGVGIAADVFTTNHPRASAAVAACAGFMDI